jgi:peroxiredoxin
MKKFGILTLLTVILMSFTYTSGYQPGDKATDFKLKSVDGKMYSMSDYKDAKGFIVVFTCNHCPFAVKYEDRVIELAKKYKSKGYVLLAINPNDPSVVPEDSFDKMKVRAKEKGFTFPYLFDEGQKIFPQYGATKTPHVFLLDKNLIVKYIGAIDDNVEDASAVKEHYLENAIAALEKGQEPLVNLTKAIGCSIKVKK